MSNSFLVARQAGFATIKVQINENGSVRLLYSDHVVWYNSCSF